MRKIELQDLLPPSVIASQSRADVLQRLASNTAGSVGGAVADGQVLSGGSSAALQSAAANANAGGGSTETLSAPLKDTTDQLTSLNAQIASLSTAQQSQSSAIQDNTQAVTQNTTTKSSNGGSTSSTLSSLASDLLGGFSLGPLVSGLISLFSSSPTTTATTAFKLPAAVQQDAGLTAGGQSVPVNYSQTGQPRAQSSNAAPQVTIQVNAMDSQSFLDHSDDIAMAVKQAILSSSSLNDVISDL